MYSWGWGWKDRAFHSWSRTKRRPPDTDSDSDSGLGCLTGSVICLRIASALRPPGWLGLSLRLGARSLSPLQARIPAQAQHSLQSCTQADPGPFACRCCRRPTWTWPGHNLATVTVTPDALTVRSLRSRDAAPVTAATAATLHHHHQPLEPPSSPRRPRWPSNKASILD